jgi:DNA-binding response OmpR family regulator
MRIVLIIENDDDIRSTLADILATQAYSPVCVEGWDQAVDYLNSHELPSLVLLDLGLPSVSGVGFLRWLRAQERLRGLRVAVMSAWRPADRDLAGFREQIVRIIQKPFEIGAVLAIVEQHCGRIGGLGPSNSGAEGSSSVSGKARKAD